MTITAILIIQLGALHQAVKVLSIAIKFVPTFTNILKHFLLLVGIDNHEVSPGLKIPDNE
jgi:stage V sporulation protein SpoVS